jgi:hypothetical protein
MSKILFIVGILALIGAFSAIFLINPTNYIPQKEAINNMEEKVYQGPVRPTDNEEHFRKTGETIPKEVRE